MKKIISVNIKRPSCSTLVGKGIARLVSDITAQVSCLGSIFWNIVPIAAQYHDGFSHEACEAGDAELLAATLQNIESSEIERLVSTGLGRVNEFNSTQGSMLMMNVTGLDQQDPQTALYIYNWIQENLPEALSYVCDGGFTIIANLSSISGSDGSDLNDFEWHPGHTAGVAVAVVGIGVIGTCFVKWQAVKELYDKTRIPRLIRKIQKKCCSKNESKVERFTEYSSTKSDQSG